MKISIYKMLYFTFCSMFFPIQSLVELPPVEDKNMATTETIIINIINNLFFTLKLDIPKKRSKIKHLSKIHNFLKSITLQDQNNLKEIARMASIAEIDNKNEKFITQLNEILDERDDKNNTAQVNNDEDITKYIDTFLEKLEEINKALKVKSELVNFRDALSLIYIKEAHNGTTPARQDNIFDYINFLKGKIHEDDARRIYEGKGTKIKKYAFMASVLFFNKFQCAGSIIKSDLIITAASCLQLAWNNRFYRENPAFVSVRVGSDFFHSGGEVIPVTEIHFHPSYNPKTLYNNLAIMRLRRKLKFGKRHKRVKKISIDRRDSGLPYNTNPITVLGWGARGASNIMEGPARNRLSLAVLDIYPLRDCQDVFTKAYVTHKNFCAGFISRGSGACNHDVGGPGISHRRLMGVISFGSPLCGTPDSPTVFTKVGYYADWIEGIMKEKVPTSNKRTTIRSRMQFTYKVREIPRTTSDSLIKPVVSGAPLNVYDTDAEINLPKSETYETDTVQILRENPELKTILVDLFGETDVEKYIEKEAMKTYIRNENVISNADDTDESIPEATITPNPINNDYEIIEENYVIGTKSYKNESKIVRNIEDFDLSKIISTLYHEVVNNKTVNITGSYGSDTNENYDSKNSREKYVTRQFTHAFNDDYDEIDEIFQTGEENDQDNNYKRSKPTTRLQSIIHSSFDISKEDSARVSDKIESYEPNSKDNVIRIKNYSKHRTTKVSYEDNSRVDEPTQIFDQTDIKPSKPKSNTKSKGNRVKYNKLITPPSRFSIVPNGNKIKILNYDNAENIKNRNKYNADVEEAYYNNTDIDANDKKIDLFDLIDNMDIDKLLQLRALLSKENYNDTK